MSRKKRKSSVLEKVESRAAGMKLVDPTLKLDDDYSLEKVLESMEQLRNKLEVHNNALSLADSSLTEVEEMEKNLNKLSQKMLMLIAIKYGTDSPQYETAGGVRDSDGFANAKGERVRKMRSSRMKNVAQQASDNNSESS
jgi:ABC-type hemin transport system substrate-binding protein